MTQKHWKRVAREDAISYLNNRKKKNLCDYKGSIWKTFSKKRRKKILKKEKHFIPYETSWARQGALYRNALYWVERITKGQYITAYDAVKIHTMMGIYWELPSASMRHYRDTITPIMHSDTIKKDDLVLLYGGDIFIGENTHKFKLINNEIVLDL